MKFRTKPNPIFKFEDGLVVDVRDILEMSQIGLYCIDEIMMSNNIRSSITVWEKSRNGFGRSLVRGPRETEEGFKREIGELRKRWENYRKS